MSYLANTFVLKISSAFTSAVYSQAHFRLDNIMDANTMSPDQTAPYCLQVTAYNGLEPYCYHTSLHVCSTA